MDIENTKEDEKITVRFFLETMKEEVSEKNEQIKMFNKLLLDKRAPESIVRDRLLPGFIENLMNSKIAFQRLIVDCERFLSSSD